MADTITPSDLETQVSIARGVADLARAIALGDRSGMRGALERLARAAMFDCVSVQQIVEDPLRGPCLQDLIWVDTRRQDADSPRLGTVPLAAIPHTAARLAAGSIHSFSRLDELPEPDRTLVEKSPAQFKALVEVPVFSGETWLGTVLFGSRTSGREWLDDEIRLLRTVADLFASTWTRDLALIEARDAVRERDHGLRLRQALVDCSTTLLGGMEGEALPVAIDTVLRAIGGSVAFVDEEIADFPGGPAFQTIHLLESGGATRRSRGPTLWRDWPGAHHALRAGKPYSFGSHDDLSGADLAFVRSFDIPVQAELDHPIIVNGELLGVVGIGDLAPRVWSDVERETLAAVATMIASYWETQRSRSRLERLLDAKDEFLASVSHELRTPLAAIVGLASLLREDDLGLGTSDREEMISLIAEQSNEMTDLVEDLLVFARAEDARLTVIPRLIDVNSLVEEVRRALPASTGVSIQVDLDTPLLAHADPLRVRQILRNLLMNAHRHGGPRVSVTGRVAGEAIQLTVSDDGPGIPDELRESIFDPYVASRGDRGRTGSIGVGLTVSRRLARLMGGDVVLREGPTTRFVVELPGAS